MDSSGTHLLNIKRWGVVGQNNQGMIIDLPSRWSLNLTQVHRRHPEGVRKRQELPEGLKPHLAGGLGHRPLGHPEADDPPPPLAGRLEHLLRQKPPHTERPEHRLRLDPKIPLGKAPDHRPREDLDSHPDKGALGHRLPGPGIDLTGLGRRCPCQFWKSCLQKTGQSVTKSVSLTATLNSTW